MVEEEEKEKQEVACWRRLLRPLVAFGAPAGCFWRFGGVLEPSWGPLGALFGNLGAILRPQKLIGSDKAKEKNIKHQAHDAFDRFGPLGGLLVRLCGHLEPS